MERVSNDMEQTTSGTDTTTATAPDQRAEQARAARAARKPARPPRKPRGISVNDPVGDMLTRVRNAVTARHESAEMPTSRMKVEIARILKAEGFISGYESNPTSLTVRLKYIGGKTPAVTGLRRISKPGLRVYARKTEMPRVLGGLGIALVSTSAGIMTGREAERRSLGGEVLAYVW